MLYEVITDKGMLARAEGVYHEDIEGVITSYSIHYTKLYENGGVDLFCNTLRIKIVK